VNDRHGHHHTAAGERSGRWALPHPGTEPSRGPTQVRWDAGRITAVAPLPVWPAGPRRLLMPALTNAHDHARTFRSSTLGTVDLPLEGWLPFLGVLPGADPYLCAATSFARSVRRGVTTLMVHYTRVQGGQPYLDEALAVARAARDVGVQIGFAVALRDRHGLAYGDDATVLAALRPGIREPVARRLSAPAVPPAEHLARVHDLVAALQSADGGTLAPHVTVQYGPNGVQWCSTALLQAVAEASATHQRPVHMHLLETRYQREWADHALPQGIVPFLDSLGLLSPRLTLAHCAWARPDELALLAERGVTIAVNTSSNLGLKSGIAPVPDMLRAGCRVAMGLDGMALDEDDDALREMRLAYALHRGWGYDTTMTRAQLWDFAAVHGRRSVLGQADDGGGVLRPGAAADLLVLDAEALDDDAELLPDVDPLDLVLARAQGGHIDEVLCGGRPVVQQGRVLGIDEPACVAELTAQVRSRLQAESAWGDWRQTVQALAEDLGPFYRRGIGPGCC
jgi:5-methylthioadenosine/S-adenosylhomocysteine deaminase